MHSSVLSPGLVIVKNFLLTSTTFGSIQHRKLTKLKFKTVSTHLSHLMTLGETLWNLVKLSETFLPFLGQPRKPTIYPSLLIEKTFCLETEKFPFFRHLKNELIQALVEFNSTRFSLIVRPHCEATKQVTFWGIIRMQNVKLFGKPATQDIIKIPLFYERRRFLNELLTVPSLFHLLTGRIEFFVKIF